MPCYRQALSEFFQDRVFLVATLALLIARWLMASYLPLGNDEAYYWDWGRALQLSYYDHPPFVAWVATVSQSLLNEPIYLQARILIPIIHLMVSLNLLVISRWIYGEPLSVRQKAVLFLALQVAPIMNLGGILLMPDAGLLLCLSSFFIIALPIVLSQLSADQLLLRSCLLGLLAGLSFSSKYHGLFISASAFSFLIITHKPCRQPLVLITIAGAFFLTASPVLFWNLQHDFISFRFQSSHGFADPQFNLLWGLRVIIAELLLCTPMVLYLMIKGFKKSHRHRGVQFLMAGCLPLLFMLLGLSFFKEVLPHWLLPSLWLLTPLVVFTADMTSKHWLRVQYAYSLVLIFAISLSLGQPQLRQWVLKAMHERPQGLGELTLWSELVAELERLDILKELRSAVLTNKAPPHCSEGILVGSLRWYWVAQLALHLPGQPKVLSFDLNHPSYYSFRDQFRKLGGCDILIIGDRRHYNRTRLERFLDIHTETELIPPLHRDRPTILVRATIRVQFDRLPPTPLRLLSSQSQKGFQVR